MTYALTLDDRIAALLPTDVGRDELWLELETVLAEMRELRARLAEAPATDLTQLRAKAEVLATLLRSVYPNGRSDIEENLNNALALSLSNDIARLP